MLVLLTATGDSTRSMLRFKATTAEHYRWVGDQQKRIITTDIADVKSCAFHQPTETLRFPFVQVHPWGGMIHHESAVS